MDRIQVQASELWDLLFADETAETYQKSLNLTGTILKEFAQLIWLIICSVFVFGAWFSDTSVRAGKSIREWIDDSSSEMSVPTDSPTASKAVAEKGKSLLDTGRTGIAYLLNQAREQLGIEPQKMPAIERTASAIKPDPKSDPKPDPKPTPKPTPSSAAATSAPAPSASTAAAEPPTVEPFSRPAAQRSSEPGSQTVGSSRGAGSQSFSSAPEEITPEEIAPEEVTREDDDGGWSAQED